MKTEDLLWELLNNILDMNFSPIITAVLVYYIIVWILVLAWVWTDISARTENWFLRILCMVIVSVLSFPGLIIYILIRPKDTVEEIFWSDLERRYLLYETDGLEDCEVCGYSLTPDYIHCPNCGETLKRYCEECEVYVKKEFNYCPFCAGKMVEGMSLSGNEKVKDLSSDSLSKDIRDEKEGGAGKQIAGERAEEKAKKEAREEERKKEERKAKEKAKKEKDERKVKEKIKKEKERKAKEKAERKAREKARREEERKAKEKAERKAKRKEKRLVRKKKREEMLAKISEESQKFTKTVGKKTDEILTNIGKLAKKGFKNIREKGSELREKIEDSINSGSDKKNSQKNKSNKSKKKN